MSRRESTLTVDHLAAIMSARHAVVLRRMAERSAQLGATCPAGISGNPYVEVNIS